MNQLEIIEAIEGYKAELDGILTRFKRSDRDSWYLDRADYSRFMEIVHEARAIFEDHIMNGDENSHQLAAYANYSITNMLGSPSYDGVDKVRGLVSAVLTRVKRNPMAVVSIATAARAAGKKDPEFIERLAERLPVLIRKLRNRHDDRATLDVNDEYDLQDLLGALLAIHFDDIRVEEWTPSFAGSPARMDFSLPEVEAVVETKMTRRALNAKKLGEELLIDIAKYEKHPQCRTLYCIVYDPEGRIANPRGLETDLEGVSAKIKVRAIIVPR